MALGVSLFVGLSLAAVLAVTTRAVTSRSLERASEDLEAAQRAFSRLVANRADFAAAQTRLITALPVFRAHMTDLRLASDVVTLEAMAEDYRRQLNAHFCIVTDSSGRWIGSTGWPAGEVPPASVLAGIGAAVNGRSERTIASIRTRLFLVVSEPARFAEETLATLTIGYMLDDAVAKELAEITRSEVNLVVGTDLSGSSLPHAARAHLRGLLMNETQARNRQDGLLVVRQIGDIPYVTGTFSLFPGRAAENVGQLVLLQDWRPTQQFLRGLRDRLLMAGIGTFALAVAGGIAFSRRMSRPLKEIAAAAGEIASGDWAREVPIRGSAEATTMATAFNEMSSHLRHWREQAQDRAERLQTSYERFHSVTESARDGIVSTNEHGSITFWNRSAALIFGYIEDDAQGRSFVELLTDPDRKKYLEALASGLGDPGLTFGQTIEVTGVRKDSSHLPIELSLSTWRRHGTTSVTAVVRDATERKRAEEELRQRETELRQAQKMESVGQLAGGIAHDFNNLLTVINGMSDLVLAQVRNDEPVHADVQEIRDAGERAATLTRQLLAFSRQQILEPRVLNFNTAVAGMESLLRRLLGEDIDLVVVPTPGLGSVKADPGQIEQVIANLAVNARDAMPQGGQLTIEMQNVTIDEGYARQHGAAMPPGSYALLAVSDSGVGMDTATRARIFEPFFTTKDPGKGTGLGLSTVYGIVKQSHGFIWVYSEVGQGTSFKIYLPQVTDAADSDRPKPTVVPSSGTETILLVEDSAGLRNIATRFLEPGGYTVLGAGTGAEALRLLKRHEAHVHLLLSDVVMPDMSGPQLAERLAQTHPGMKVLYMSGYTGDTIARHGVLDAQMPFLGKPFSAAALLHKVREVLDSPA